MKSIIDFFDGKNPRLIISIFIIAFSWIIPDSFFRVLMMVCGFLLCVYPFLIKYKYIIMFISYVVWFSKSIKPIEYIDNIGNKKYGLAIYKDGDWVVELQSFTFTLSDDGLIRDSGINWFWFPLKYNERVQHIFSTDLPDFAPLLSMSDVKDKARYLEDEYNKRK